MGMIARRLGHSVVLLEKYKHPRFAIGESSTPLANLLIEELAAKYDLSRLRPLTKWGPWQTAYPEIGCGLKRGFTFYHHDFNKGFRADPDRSDQLLVAASPHDRISDTHWYRPDFDQFLMNEARNLGVEYFDETSLDTVSERGDWIEIDGTRFAARLSVRCRFLIDASGPRGFLHRALHLSDAGLPNYLETQALFTHFTGVKLLSELPIDQSCLSAPFPVDAAAVHHVFDGGWIWVLRFNNGITSAGVAARDGFANRLNFSAGAAAWRSLMELLPTVGEQFSFSKTEFEFVHAKRLSFLSNQIVGNRWAMLPSAAGFVDPLLSTGFPLTLLGIGRMAEIIDRHWEAGAFQPELEKYADDTRGDLLAASRLVAGLYASMNDFPKFIALSKLYFAAVVYSESARRLGKPHLANSFLLREHQVFGPCLREITDRATCPMSPAERTSFIRKIHDVIAPFDLAGLSKRDRQNWYPVRPDDLLDNAAKLGVERDEIQRMLEGSGFWGS